jgi:hypothetical protein
MASIDIKCPECKKQLKGPQELIGKKIRCKSCKATFTVSAPKAVAGKGAASSSAKTKPDAAPGGYAFEDEEGKNPYKMTDVIKISRCPQCAADMEAEDIICLNCGYNTETRIRIQTVKTYQTTFFDWIIWLTPGVLCVLVVLAMIGAVIWLWIPAGLPRLAQVNTENEAWWGHFSIRIYGSVAAAGISWVSGKFAFKRLVLHPTPPDKLKR